MNWPQEYMKAERPSGLGTSASPSPTTLLETVRGLTVSIGTEMPSTKCAVPYARHVGGGRVEVLVVAGAVD